MLSISFEPASQSLHSGPILTARFIQVSIHIQRSELSSFTARRLRSSAELTGGACTCFRPEEALGVAFFRAVWGRPLCLLAPQIWGKAR